MKIRSDFVTNSSNTSFIVGELNQQSDEFIVEMKVKINLKNFYHDQITSIEELVKCQDESVSMTDDEYKKCKEIIEEGGVVYAIHVSDNGTGPLESLLCHNGLDVNMTLPDNLIVIRGEGGY